MKNLLTLIQKRFGSSCQIDESTPLLSSGIISSFDLLEFLCLIESETSIRIESSEVGVDNFDSVRQIESFLLKRKSV